MTNDQIRQLAWTRGYDASIMAGAVLVRLGNRGVSTIEVVEALNVPAEAVAPSSTLPHPGVWVLGSDGFEAGKAAYGLPWAEYEALEQADIDETAAAVEAAAGRV